MCILLSNLEVGDGHPAWEDVSSSNSHLKTLWTQWDRLKIFGGVLYRIWEKRDVDEQSTTDKKTQDLLHFVHDIPYSGHLGVDKTFERLKNGFYWPEMKEYIKMYCKSCHKCSARKPRKNNPAHLAVTWLGSLLNE
jgi:hypothetical protein